MAPTNRVVLGLALQSAVGDPADAPQFRITVTAAGDLGPNIEIGQREETGNTRDGGDRMVTQRAVGGSFSTILRPTTAPLLYYMVLGAKAVSGAGPYVHTITAAEDQPWITVWKFWGGVFAERYEDCKLVSANLTGGAGQNVGDLVAQFGLVGKAFSDITSGLTYDPYDPADTDGGVFDSSDPIRWYGSTHVRALVGGGSPATITNDVDQFTNNITANQETAQTTHLYFDKVEPGLRNIEHSYQEILSSSVATYKRGAYGSPTATSPTDTIDEAELTHTFKDSAGTTRLVMTVPVFGHGVAELPVSPNGEIGRLQASGFAMRPASGSIETCVFTNSTATYPNAT